MNAEIIFPRRNNRRKPRALRPELPECMIEIRLVLIFELARIRISHHCKYACTGFLLCTAQCFNFAGLFNQAQQTRQLSRIFNLQIRKISLNGVKQSMRRTIRLVSVKPIKVKVQLCIFPACREARKIIFEPIQKTNILNAWFFRRFMRFRANSRPTLHLCIRRQQIKPFRNLSVRRFCGKQHGRLAF